jgi:hypothetical protein
MTDLMPRRDTEVRNSRSNTGSTPPVDERVFGGSGTQVPRNEPSPRNVRSPRSHPPGDPIYSAKPALQRFATVVLVFLAFCALPYAHKSMEDYRYLDLIDGSPIVRALTFQAPKSMQSTAPTVPVALGEGETSGLQGDVEGLMPVDPALAAAAKGARAGGKRAKGGKTANAKPGAGIESDTPARKKVVKADPMGRDHPLLHDDKPDQVTELPAALQVSDETFGEQKTFIEDPQHVLDPFYRALVALAYGERDKVRIRHYGDSHLANDGITHAARVMMQRRFGDGGHGFTLVAARTKWYSHKGIRRNANDGWKPRNFLGGSLKDGAYGYGGVAALGQMGSVFTAQTARKGFGSKASRIELWFRGVAMGRMRLTIDKKSVVQKVGHNTGDRWKVFDVADGSHKFRVKVESGWMRLFGVVMERDKGLVYDSLGVVGARASRWRNANAMHLKGQYQRRPTELLVVNYGGNSRNDKVSESKYIARYMRSLERLRVARPNEACLVISPTAHGKRKRGKVIGDAATERMVKWQRTLAAEAGCAFFDANAWMAEVGDMQHWVKRKLVWHDMAHLTPRGQSLLGHAVYRGYLKGLSDFMAREGDGIGRTTL